MRPAVQVVAMSLALATVFAAIPGLAADDDLALRGEVRDEKGPLTDVEVAVGVLGWIPAAGDHVVTGATGADGKFELPRAPLGPADVWVRRKGGTWSFGLRMSRPGVRDLVLEPRLRPAVLQFDVTKVSGVVTDKQKRPIAGASLGWRGDETHWAVSDASGAFTLEDVSPGDGLVVRARGYRDLVTEVAVGAKSQSVQLEAVKPTVVKVTDPSGKPVPDAWVTLGDPDAVLGTTGFTSLFPPRARLVGAFTDAKGEAKLSWGHTEDATVATAHAARFAPASKEITAGKGPVTLKLSPPQPVRATVVLKDSGEPLAGVHVGLPHESDGGPDAISALPEESERGPIVVGRTDEKGQCVIPHLDAKVTTLRVVGEHKLRAAVTLERLPINEPK